MADTFISYAKAYRLVVEQLAATLEAEGWSDWWDKGPSAGDAYSDEIMTELALVPARRLNRRFVFLLLGLGLLLGLNEIAKLELWRFVRA